MKRRLLIAWHKLWFHLHGGFSTEAGVRHYLAAVYHSCPVGPLPRGKLKIGLAKFHAKDQTRPPQHEGERKA